MTVAEHTIVDQRIIVAVQHSVSGCGKRPRGGLVKVLEHCRVQHAPSSMSINSSRSRGFEMNALHRALPVHYRTTHQQTDHRPRP